MAENKGNKEAAAERLGIDLATLYRKLKKLRIETP
jgi:transcriptional regulator of acetoin/glycerol metabolism